MDIRRIDLTPRSLERSLWEWFPKRARRAIIAVGFLAPVLAIVVILLPGAAPAQLTSATAARTSYFVPIVKAIRAAAHHQVTTNAPAPSTTPAPVVVTTTTTAPPPPPAPVTTTTAAPVEEPAVDTSSAAAWAASPGVECIRDHESGDNYSEDTGNGYYGAYQDELSTWEAVGGTGLPSDAPPAVQDQLNYEIYLSGGWGQWGTAAGCGL